MKALFSRRNNERAEDQNMSIYPAAEDLGSEKRRASIASITVNPINKTKKGPPQASYLASALAKHNDTTSSFRHPILFPNTSQTIGKAHGTDQSTATFSKGSEGVGDNASVSYPSVPSYAGKRSSKGLFSALRNSGSVYFGRRGGLDARSEANDKIQSSPIQRQESANRFEASSQSIAAITTSSFSPQASSVGLDSLSSRLPLQQPERYASSFEIEKELSSAHTQILPLPPLSHRDNCTSNISHVQKENLTFKQEAQVPFERTSQFKGQHLSVNDHQNISRSEPSSPHFPSPDAAQRSSTRIEQSVRGDTSSLKKSLRRYRFSSKATAEQEIKGDAASVDRFDRPIPSSQTFTAMAETTSPIRSQDLASELNELAVAYEEGLLGKDEYRMLRQNVFEKMMGRGEMEIPKEKRLQGRSAVSNDKVLSESSKSNATLSPALSMRSRHSSKSNLVSLFRRDSKTEGNLQSSGSAGPASSSRSALHSVNESFASEIPQGGRSKITNSSLLESKISQARQARTLRGNGRTSGSEGLKTFDQSQLGDTEMHSQKGPCLYSASVRSLGDVHLSNGSALLGGSYMSKSSDEILAEIAVVEAEGRRILESFRSLQMNAMGRYNLSFEAMKRVIDGMGGSAEGGMNFCDDFVMIDGKEGGGGGTRINGHASSKRKMHSLGSLIRKSKSSSGLDAQIVGQGSDTNQRTETITAPSDPSYKLATSLPSTSSASPPTLPLESHLATRFTAAEGEADEEDVDVARLRAELIDIVRRRDEVSRKYSDRLAFLKSNMRSAKIREGLR
ncbi:hypothetical protein CBS101457_006134 [Exobasidium rhododendri]|nr:hypothetical protein CBS101457_006134 [Exobasidium rhododendri]